MRDDRVPQVRGSRAGEPADVLAKLARDASAGDAAARQRLLRELAPPMIAVLRQMVPLSELEDATQDALLGLVRALPSFRYECGVRHFACRVAVHSATVGRRKRASLARADELERARHVDDGLEHARGPATVDGARAARRRALVRSLLAELPEAQAECLALRIVLECSLQEVADAVGAPVNTVRSRLRLAKESLRARIASDPSFAELIDDDDHRGARLDAAEAGIGDHGRGDEVAR